jgi:DNA-binding beta-propeller fold protein YncE
VNYRSMFATLAASIMLAGCGSNVPTGSISSSAASHVTTGQVWHVTPLLQALQPDGIAVNSSRDVYFTELPASSAKILQTDGKVESVVAHLKRAQGIAVYKDITYIADTGNFAVKRILSNGKVTTIGSGWDYPRSVNTDSAGNLYVFDNSLRKIVRFRNGKQTDSISIPSSCPGVTNGLGLDEQKNLYISCYDEDQVLKIQPDGTATEMCSGWQSPDGITSDPAGDVYVANNNSKSIFECTASGQLKTIVTNEQIGEVTGIAFHDSDLYVTSTDKREIYKLSPP